MGIEVETFSQNHPPLNHHHWKKERRPNKTPPHGIFRPHHGISQPLDTVHLTTWKPPKCATASANQLPQTHHTQKRWQRHTLLQTGYHSSARHRHSLPPGAKIGILEENEKDKTALPSPISKLPSTRPALSKPPSWVLLLRKPLRIAKENRNPRYHLSSTSSCREMEKLSQPPSFVSSCHCHLPARRTTSLPLSPPRPHYLPL